MNVQRLKTTAELDLERSFSTPPSPAQIAFAAQGLPHRRVEAFKYTDLRLLIEEALPLAPAPTQAEINAHKPRQGLVFINGYFVGSLSLLPKGVSLCPYTPLNLAIAKGNELLALHAAFTTPVVALHVEGDVALELFSFCEPGQAAFPHLFLHLHQDATLTLNETINTHFLLETRVEKGATFTHTRCQTGGKQIFTTLLAQLESNAELNQFTLITGGKLTRHQQFVRLVGDECKVNLNGIALLNHANHADTSLVIEHVGLRGESRELFKHILSDKSKGVFQGKIIVQKDAQKTDGKMSSNAVMLEDDCEMMNKPELEIYADDVVCGHGATVGQLDDDLLFYMQARGLPPQVARALLLQAFCGEALEIIANQDLKEAFTTQMMAALKAF